MSSLSERFDWYEPHQKWISGESGGVRASLDGASLDGANLDGAKFADGFTGTKDTKVCQLTGVGSENGTLIIVKCKEGHFINRGCFRGSVAEFLNAVKKTHGDTEYGKFYRGVMKLYCKKEYKKWKAQQEAGE